MSKKSVVQAPKTDPKTTEPAKPSPAPFALLPTMLAACLTGAALPAAGRVPAHKADGVFLELLGVLGWRFGGTRRRGRGARLHFWRGSCPPEAVNVPRASLRSFVLREIRKRPR